MEMSHVQSGHNGKGKCKLISLLGKKSSASRETTIMTKTTIRSQDIQVDCVVMTIVMVRRRATMTLDRGKEREKSKHSVDLTWYNCNLEGCSCKIKQQRGLKRHRVITSTTSRSHRTHATSRAARSRQRSKEISRGTMPRT